MHGTLRCVFLAWAEKRDHYRFTGFYMQQRKRLGLLLDEIGAKFGTLFIGDS